MAKVITGKDEKGYIYGYDCTGTPLRKRCNELSPLIQKYGYKFACTRNHGHTGRHGFWGNLGCTWWNPTKIPYHMIKEVDENDGGGWK